MKPPRHLLLPALGALTSLGCYDLSLAELEAAVCTDCVSVSQAQQVSGPGSESLLVDSFVTGGFVAAGTYGDTTTLDPGGPGEATLQSVSAATTGGFVARYTQGLELLWASPLEATGTLWVHDVAALTDGSFALTGQFGTTLTFGADSEAPVALSAAADPNAFVAVLDPKGTPRWALSEGGVEQDRGEAVAVGSVGGEERLVVAGSCMGPATFGEGMDTVQLDHFDQGKSQGFLAAYRLKDGTLRWVTPLYGVTSISDVGVVGEQVFVAGWLRGVAELRSATAGVAPIVVSALGESDALFATYDLATGDVGWVQQVGGSGGTAEAKTLAVQADGSVTLGGEFTGEVDFDAGGSGDRLTAQTGSADVFVARYDAHEPGVGAALRWVRAIAGPDQDRISSLALEADGSVLVGGGFDAPSTMLAGGSTSITLESAGFADGFIARYTSAGAVDWAFRLGGVLPGDAVHRVVIPAPGSVVLAGEFNGDLTFGPHGSAPLMTATGNADGFLLRLAKGQPGN